MANRFMTIKDYYKDFMKQWENKHSRLRSYDPCKEYFDRHYGRKLTPIKKDEFCLRLFSYLASWGMFRGNDWLIWKSYTVFEDVADILFDTKYKPLKDIDPLKNGFGLKKGWDIDKYVEKACELYREVHDTLKKTLDTDSEEYEDDKKRANAVSQLMTCKILMGTYGCVIAYDSFDMKGLRAVGITSPQTKSIEELFRETCKLIIRYKNEFLEIMNDMKQYKVNYTVFKVLDMILWEHGKKVSAKKAVSAANAQPVATVGKGTP